MCGDAWLFDIEGEGDAGSEVLTTTADNDRLIVGDAGWLTTLQTVHRQYFTLRTFLTTLTCAHASPHQNSKAQSLTSTSTAASPIAPESAD